jgi:hypothetical protein
MQMSQLTIAHHSSDHFLGAGFAAGFAATVCFFVHYFEEAEPSF